MKTVYCTSTKAWVACTPEIEAAMAKGESVRVNAGTEPRRQTGDAQAGRRPNDTDAIAEAVVASFREKFREQFSAGLLAARDERTNGLRETLSTLGDDEVAAATEKILAAHEQAGEKVGYLTAMREALRGREAEFLAAQEREMYRPHRERLAAFDRAQTSATRAPSLREREAAAEADSTLGIEAELMADRDGISILDAARKIERTRALEARLAAAKGRS